MNITLFLNNQYFLIDGISPQEIPNNSSIFCSNVHKGNFKFTYTFHFIDILPSIDDSWEVIYLRPNINIWSKNSLECRLLGVSSNHNVYALYEETSPDHANIWFKNSWRSQLNIDTIFISCLALERRMANLNSYILHCAYIVNNGKAILFSGPSGIGKSTHAQIWEQNIEGTRIINGDRCLITRNTDGTFMANGWPVCGSSQICHNESYPLHAIVFIQQTEENQVIEETAAKHFRRLFTQVTVNRWNQASLITAIDWMQDLINKVGIVTYGCNMSPDAPIPLINHLETI